MSWDTISDLASPAINELALEQNAFQLWNEYLGGYFDGNIHHLSGQSRKFPLAKLSFQQSSLGKPIDANAISLTWLKDGNPVRRLWNGHRVTFLKTVWTFYIRAAAANIGEGNAEVMIKTMADLIYGLLSDRARTLPLARRGIRHIHPGQHTLVASLETPMRKLEVKAELIFADSASSLLVTDDDAVLIFTDGSQWSVDAT